MRADSYHGSPAVVPKYGTGSRRDRTLDQLAHAVYRLSAAEARLRVRSSRTAGALTLNQARALRVLAEHGCLSINELTAAVGTAGSAASTQLVRKLVKAGYATATRRPNDRRYVTVTLTELGRQHYAEFEHRLLKFLHTGLIEHDTSVLDAATGIVHQLAVFYDEL